MAFIQENFSAFAQTVSGGAMRLFVYVTNDGLAAVLVPNYFTRIDRTGARVGDLVVVIASGLDTLCSVSAIGVNGDGTVIPNEEQTTIDSVTARQWQSALAIQDNLVAVRDAIPADVNDAITIQWFSGGRIRPPPVVDPVWDHTQATLGLDDVEMLDIYDLAVTQDS